MEFSENVGGEGTFFNLLVIFAKHSAPKFEGALVYHKWHTSVHGGLNNRLNFQLGNLRDARQNLNKRKDFPHLHAVQTFIS